MKIQFEKIFRNLLVIDIETASAFEEYQNMDERMQTLWDKKASFMQKTEETASEDLYFDKGAIYAEFGKIVSIALGFYTEHENNKIGIRVKGIADHDEVKLLQQFNGIIEKLDQVSLKFCAHNGKEFDYPYLSRRMLVNGIDIPETLELRNKKPWEILHIDTMEEWKFGDRKNFTSLDLLATIFGIESSKDGIDGSMVNAVYYDDNDLSKITTYCMQDVAVTAQVYLKLINNHNFSTEHIQLLPN